MIKLHCLSIAEMQLLGSYGDIDSFIDETVYYAKTVRFDRVSSFTEQKSGYVYLVDEQQAIWECI